MADPLRRLKYLPWRSLLQVSGLTILLVIVLELFLSIASTQSYPLRNALATLYSPPMGMILSFATAVGVGALAVYLLERFHQRVFINTASLWALVPCLALVLYLKSLLPVPPLLVRLDYFRLIGVIAGIFWKGRPHW